MSTRKSRNRQQPRWTIQIGPNIYSLLKAHANERGQKIRWVAEQAIDRYLAAHEGKEQRYGKQP